jgi:N-dimethylarginine dimethylaminohydrolase
MLHANPTAAPRIAGAEMTNPSRLEQPAYLMNVPLSIAADVANNVWMEEIDARERRIEKRKAIHQFMQLYHFMAAEALVYLLPTPRTNGLQDLVYCANLGAVLDHLPDRDTVVLTKFCSQVRIPEEDVGRQFFEEMGYRVEAPPHCFEGEAELKHLHDNVYAGGYGIRSDAAAYDWMMDEFDMHVVKLQETEAHLYHLDCTVFPLTRENTLVCTELYSPAEVRQLEHVTNIIDVTADECFSGICNCVRLGNTLLNASNIHEMNRSDAHYDEELAKNRKLEDIATRNAFEVAYFNLGEFLKSGALLSCMVMHLNRKSYDMALM